MANKLNFNDFYKKLDDDNAELKAEFYIYYSELKKRKAKENKIILGFAMLFLIILVIFIIKHGISINIIYVSLAEIWMFMMVLFFLFFISTWKNESKKDFSDKQSFTKKYKENISKLIFENFMDNVEFFPNKEMPEEIYEKGTYGNYDIYFSEDYTECLIEKKYITSFADVLTKEKYEVKDEDGKTHTETRVLFSGVFVNVKLPKSINGNFYVYPDVYAWENGNIKLDSTLFEKYFSVIADDKIKAMEILTPEIMEFLISKYTENKITYSIRILNDEMYIEFNCGNSFELSYANEDILNMKNIKDDFDLIKNLCEIVTRIGERIEEIV